MIATRFTLLSAAACIGVMLWIAPARADSFSSWIATTCDSQSGRAAVRFGYADTNDPPLFLTLPDPSIDHGISKIPVTDASQHAASCRLVGGREVKARLDSGGEQFSIWVDGRRIAHNIIGATFLPFELIVYPTGIRLCTFQLAPGDWMYDVTSASYKPTPIKCALTLSPISGSKRP
jgi:hypothetical protein